MAFSTKPQPPEAAKTDEPEFYAVDELNLAEFPLAAISDRFLAGTKTVVFDDTVWDHKSKQRLPRQLTISGSDRYGLPTAKDDDVLLACVQVSSMSEFGTREVHFSRYHLLKLLRWKDETRNYRRLLVSLRRWKGLSVFSNRAFYDKSRQSWVNRDFGVFDNLYVYERETDEGQDAPASSWFVWNEVLFESFQAGYLKRLDWDLYCRLESPVAKRLYRFLDKRFYHASTVEIDLRELSFRKLRIGPGYNTAQAKRVLLHGIHELEAKWDLKPVDDQQRFRKTARGEWTVFLQRRRQKRPQPPRARESTVSVSLAVELTRRGIGPAMAEELVAGHDPADIQTMTELFDWYNEHGQPRGPGFLVDAIKNPRKVVQPRGFETRAARKARDQRAATRRRAERKAARRRERDELAAHQARLQPFREFWGSLNDELQRSFEAEALKRADRIKQLGYCRAMGQDEQVFEHYRQMILCDHFERDRKP